MTLYDFQDTSWAQETAMTVIERLQQQVDIRGTASPFGALAADALAEIATLAYWGPRWEAEHKENERLREALAALLACPSGMYCDAYPEAEKQARTLLVHNAKVSGASDD